MPKSRSLRKRTGPRPLEKRRERNVPRERRQVAEPEPAVENRSERNVPRERRQVAEPEPAVERLNLLADEGNSDDTWIVGDSLVHWAGLTAESRDKNLGVPGVSVGWHGVRGMVWDGFVSHMQLLSMSSVPPRTVLVHLGGNDFEKLSVCQINNRVKRGLKYLKSLFPGVKVIWIDIIQRLKWRCDNPAAMEDKRKRINRYGHNMAVWLSGDALSIDVDSTTPGFYRDDGVHLSPVGIAMYLDGIQEKLISINK